MANEGRPAWVFVAGALLGGAVAVWAYMAWSPPRGEPMATTATPLPAALPASAEAAQPPTVQTVAAPAACAFQPLVTRSSERDGLFALDHALALHRSSDASPFLVVADEAAREGRARDAEVALMAACRIAGQAAPGSAPAADVQSRLAHHYANIAARESDQGMRVQLLERAEALLGSSVQVYSAAFGQQASRTRMAQQQLAALREPGARLASLPDRERPAPVVVQDTSSSGAARLSLAERPPVRSEPVGQLDQDLERLYSQARAVSRDPAGLERRHQQALAQRQACRGDEDCLRGWHAQRKRQLFGEFAAR